MMTSLNAETKSEHINAHTDLQKATVTCAEADYIVLSSLKQLPQRDYNARSELAVTDQPYVRGFK